MKKYLCCIFMTLFILTGCMDSEKEANMLFSSAVNDWKRGDINEAKIKFDRLQKEFGETETAQAAVQVQERLLKGYKAQFSPRLAAATNNKSFGRMVVRGINRYLNTNGEFPTEIEDIELSGSEEYNALLSLCSYQKAVNNRGYKLDCSDAEIQYEMERKERKTARKTERIIAKAIRSGTFVRNINHFPKAASTWGEKFNPGGQLPDIGFHVYYLNTNNPEKMIAQDQVEAISVHYSWSELHNIKSEDFGAYWVGSIELPEAKNFRIGINQGWSRCRLIIDGALVFNGESEKEILLHLDEGSHKIEVEYINNWHTTDFSVSFSDHQIKLSEAEIASTLHSLGNQYQIYNVAVYESSNMDHSITLNLNKTDTPVVLFLSSYNAVKWEISNPHQVDILAVVFGASSPGTSVTGDIDGKALQLLSQKRMSGYSLVPSCSCIGGNFHCEGQNGLHTINHLRQLGGAEVTGFSGEYSTAALDVPAQRVNREFVMSLEQDLKENETLRKQCDEKKNQILKKCLKTINKINSAVAGGL